MTQEEYNLVAQSIWRSGYIQDKNKIRQAAKQAMRRLISIDLAASFAHKDPKFNTEKFMEACSL